MEQVYLGLPTKESLEKPECISYKSMNKSTDDIVGTSKVEPDGIINSV